MDFSFGEHVKLATKGFKPSDIAELSGLDDKKFSKDDIMTLVGSGYKIQDIKKLIEVFNSSNENADKDDPEPEEPNTPEDAEQEQNKDSDDPDNPDDSVDYKMLYEKEKKLREKLQQSKVKSKEGPEKPDDKTDYQIALDIAQDVLS